MIHPQTPRARVLALLGACVVASVPAASAQIAPGAYRLHSQYQGDDRCLDAVGDAHEYGRDAFMNRCDDTPSQVWIVEPTASGGRGFQLRLRTELNRAGGVNPSARPGTTRAVCLNGNLPEAGPALVNPCGDNLSQTWVAVALRGEAGHYRLKYTPAGPLCLESNARQNSHLGGDAHMAPCRNVTGQFWRFIPVAGPPTPRPATSDASGPGYLTGVQVCQALIPAVTEGRTTGEPFRTRATSSVLRTLSADARSGQAPDADEVRAWSDRPGTCSLSAGGDAWFVLTLEGMDGDIGERATRVRLTNSYE